MGRNSAETLQEKIEVLDGSRNKEMRRKAAVRVEDFSDLLNLAQVKTQTLTAAPTMANFNTLLEDIREISEKLNAVSAAIQGRLLR